MVSPRVATVAALTALPAIGYYALVKEQIVIISLINVVIIAAALFIAFGPLSGDGQHGHDHA
jgi:hypothetical protein